jgi:hypothetical protein
MLTAEAKAYALVQAAATALAKGRSAVSKHQRVTARRQMRASAGFCSAAVKVLITLSGKRSKAAQALRAGGSQEIFMSSDGFAAFQDSVRASGLPADLVALMKSFGVTKGGLNRARAGVLVFGTQDPSPVLISALTDAEQTKATSTLIAELNRFAKRARNSPTLPGRRLGRQDPLRRRTAGRARRPG